MALGSVMEYSYEKKKESGRDNAREGKELCGGKGVDKTKNN